MERRGCVGHERCLLAGMIVYPSSRRRLPTASLIWATVILAVDACTGHAPPPQASVTLASIAANSTLIATISGSVLFLAIQEPSANGGTVAANEWPIENGPCPVVNATATLNGQPMSVSSPGSGQATAIGDGCGNSTENQCVPPTFSAPIIPGSALALDIVISDESARLEFQMNVPSVQVTIEGSEDAGLVSGASTTLAFSPSLASSGSVEVDFYGEGAAGNDAGTDADSDLTGTPSFVCALAGGLCGLVATATSASFIVPDVPPQNGALLVRGLIIDPNVNCTGVAGCELGSTYGESVAIETHVSP
jgi:hypothetical protein